MLKLKHMLKVCLREQPEVLQKLKNLEWFGVNCYYKIINVIGNVLFRFCPIKSNRIVFINFGGSGYGGSPKYITEALLRTNKELDLVWLLTTPKNTNGIPSRVRTVKYKSLRAIYELATAKVWVDNHRKSFFPLKKRNQYYMQTWHGCITPKRMEREIEDTLGDTYVTMAKKDSKMIDCLLSNSTYATKMFKDIFWYNGEILELGIPCEDVYYEKCALRQNVRHILNVSDDDYLVLYAPTFRDNGDVSIYKWDYTKVIASIEKRVKKKVHLLLKLHPNVASAFDNKELPRGVRNVSHYEDMQELLVASDCVISDYSSVSCEFAFQERPVFLYMPDIIEYSKKRSFRFDFESLPYPLAKNENEQIGRASCRERV